MTNTLDFQKNQSLKSTSKPADYCNHTKKTGKR